MAGQSPAGGTVTYTALTRCPLPCLRLQELVNATAWLSGGSWLQLHTLLCCDAARAPEQAVQKGGRVFFTGEIQILCGCFPVQPAGGNCFSMAVGLWVLSNPYDSMILGPCKASLLFLQWCKESVLFPYPRSHLRLWENAFIRLNEFHMDLEEPAAISRKITESSFK